jgi:hypothetical protein
MSLPTIDDVKTYLDTGVTTGSLPSDRYTDEDLTAVLDAETAAQALVCTIPTEYPPDLFQALLRRVQRGLTLRTMPVGMLTGDAEIGPAVVPGRDPEVRRLEAGHRRLVVA